VRRYNKNKNLIPIRVALHVRKNPVTVEGPPALVKALTVIVGQIDAMVEVLVESDKFTSESLTKAQNDVAIKYEQGYKKYWDEQIAAGAKEADVAAAIAKDWTDKKQDMAIRDLAALVGDGCSSCKLKGWFKENKNSILIGVAGIGIFGAGMYFLKKNKAKSKRKGKK